MLIRVGRSLFDVVDANSHPLRLFYCFVDRKMFLLTLDWIYVVSYDNFLYLNSFMLLVV